MKTSHLSEFELQWLLELSTSEREHNNVYHHIRVCLDCENRFHDLERLHLALGEQQIGHADEVQIERLMERIRSGGHQSLFIPVLYRFAYVLAMLLVLSVIGVIFYQLDIFDLSVTGASTGEMFVIIPEYVRLIQNQFTELGKSLIVFYDRIFRLEAAPVIAFTVVFLFFVAIFDRLVLSPILQRER
jgi:hypothetical protein